MDSQYFLALSRQIVMHYVNLNFITYLNFIKSVDDVKIIDYSSTRKGFRALLEIPILPDNRMYEVEYDEYTKKISFHSYVVEHEGEFSMGYASNHLYFKKNVLKNDLAFINYEESYMNKYNLNIVQS